MTIPGSEQDPVPPPPSNPSSPTTTWIKPGMTGADLKQQYADQAARERSGPSAGKVLAGAEINDAMKQLRQQKNWERKAALALGLDSRKITEMPEDELYAKLKSVGFHF